MKKFIIISLIAGSLIGCKKEEQKAELTPEFPVTRVIHRDTILYQEYVGDINALRNVEIRARVQGYLDHIYVDEGDQVKAGQALFRINDEEYQAELARAKANLSTMTAEALAEQLEMNRLKLLVDKNVLSKTEWDLATARHQAAQAKVEEAKSAVSRASIMLSHTLIRAPFDGVIDRIPFKIGSLIDEGTLLTTVSDLASVYVYFKVSEAEYLHYMKSKRDSRNGEIYLLLADGSVHPHRGEIETMDGEFDTSTGTIAFRARFENPEKLLKHGSSGKIRLATIVEDALMLPQKATLEIQDKTYVFLVDANNKVKMHPFTPQKRFSHFYIVESGLQAGDRIIYEGIQNVREGITIKPAPVEMEALLVARKTRDAPKAEGSL